MAEDNVFTYEWTQYLGWQLAFGLIMLICGAFTPFVNKLKVYKNMFFKIEYYGIFVFRIVDIWK